MRLLTGLGQECRLLKSHLMSARRRPAFFPGGRQALLHLLRGTSVCDACAMHAEGPSRTAPGQRKPHAEVTCPALTAVLFHQ